MTSINGLSDLTAHLIYITVIIAMFVWIYTHARRKASKIVTSQNPTLTARTCIKTLNANLTAVDKIEESSKKLDSSIIDLPPIVAEAIANKQLSEKHVKRVMERIAG